MNNAKSIKAVIAQMLPQLRSRYPIEELAIFGSAIRDDYEPGNSDVDIMVKMSDETGYEFVELAEELEQLLGCRVDLVSKGALKSGQWEYLKSRLEYV